MRILTQQETHLVAAGHDQSGSFTGNALGFAAMVAGGITGGMAYALASGESSRWIRSVVPVVISTAFSSALTCLLVGMGKEAYTQSDVNADRD